MKKESCYFFASISKSFKTDGTIIIKNNNGLKEINIEEPLFIEFNDIMVPFFLEEIEYRNNISALAKFETINSEEQTIDYIGKGIYAEKKKLSNKNNDNNEFLIGFEVYNQQKEILGKIIDFQDIPGNPIIIVQKEDHEIFIPFHEDFIISMNEKKEKIILEIPDGLFDINAIN
jgi:16S rRNA processing protein RimM